MKIRYDAKGSILAVGDDGCDWQGRVLGISERDVPGDLLATFALGKYVVREGKVAKTQERPPAAAPLEELTGVAARAIDPAMLRPAALAAASRNEPAVAAPAAKAAAKSESEPRPKRKARKARKKSATKSAGSRTGRIKREKR